jgi:hypothetical protein
MGHSTFIIQLTLLADRGAVEILGVHWHVANSRILYSCKEHSIRDSSAKQMNNRHTLYLHSHPRGLPLAPPGASESSSVTDGSLVPNLAHIAKADGRQEHRQ